MADQTVGEYRYSHPAIALRWAGATDPGLRRTVNEDSVFASFPVFVVADGMGGHEAGDVASALAVEAFRSLKGRMLASVEGVEQSVEAAFASVREGAHGQHAGGTTLSGAVLVDIAGTAHWMIVNVGDSRTYMLADGRLDQISVDHSVVQELVESGVVDRWQARKHPQRNVITRAIGAGTESVPDYWVMPAERGQRLLVCSDGLSGEVDDAELSRVLSTVPSPAEAAATLVRAALAAGAPDNVSVIVVDADAVAHSDGAFNDTGRVVVDDTLPSDPRRSA